MISETILIQSLQFALTSELSPPLYIQCYFYSEFIAIIIIIIIREYLFADVALLLIGVGRWRSRQRKCSGRWRVTWTGSGSVMPDASPVLVQGSCSLQMVPRQRMMT